MKVIILSAGRGRRLLPLTEDRPKCALLVEGRAILEWQLMQIAQCAVDEVVIATGYGAEIVEDLVSRGEFGSLRVRCSHNPFHAHSDNLGTCWLLRHEMQGEFIVLNGDTLFEAAVMQRLIDERRAAPIVLAADQKAVYDDDDMLIVADGRRLLRVGKRLGPIGVNAESIGMMSFDAEGGAAFVRSLDAMMRSEAGLSRWYLSVIDQLAQEGNVGLCSIHGLSWCEVDTRLDLARAEHVVRGWPMEAAPDEPMLQMAAQLD